MNRREFLRKAGLSVAALSLLGADDDARAGPATQPDYRGTGARLVKGRTPSKDGYRFPAEWAPHAFTLMVMPTAQNWSGHGFPMKAVRRQWADIANAISEFEPVRMVVDPADAKTAKPLLAKAISIIELPVNDGWARDSGPMFLTNGKGGLRVAGFTFNGWGAKWPPYDDDALLKARLCKALDVPMYPIDLVVEGGAVALDGEGTLLTTEQCLLHRNRNRRPKAEVEKILNASLGTTRVVWLGKGLEPDPITDGHVDGLAAFAKPGVVLLHMTDDRHDPNFGICRDARKRLRAARDAKGRKLEIIELPLLGDVAHMNFYIGNGCVVVPTNGSPRLDDKPLGVVREAFPGRNVVPLTGRVLAKGGGGIHCITQQVPKVPRGG